MYDNQENELDKLYQTAWDCPDGVARVAILEEVIRLADSTNDERAGFQVRMDLIESATASGLPDKATVAFAWCLAMGDRNPDHVNWHGLMWKYKVILELIPTFYTVSRNQIESMQEDMGARYERLNEGPRTANYYRCWNWMRMGDYDKARQFEKLYIKAKRTEVSDCLACERDRQVELKSRMHEDKAALRHAKPILKGKMTCGEVPEFTYSSIFRSMMRLGKDKHAHKLFDKAVSDCRSERKFVGSLGDLLLFQTRHRNFDAALSLFARYIPWATETAAHELRFRFFAPAALMFEALAESQPETVPLRLPEELGCFQKDHQYEPAELAKWFATDAQSIADKFDQRNGTRSFRSILADNRELARLG